jgi:hypothetical protein
MRGTPIDVMAVADLTRRTAVAKDAITVVTAVACAELGAG